MIRPFIAPKKLRSVTTIIVFLLLGCGNNNAQTGFVTVRGRQIIAPDGSPLLLKGIGLGNWLLPEGYMFQFTQANSPRRIETVINQLIGEEEGRKFWKTYQDRYITRDDIHFIKSAGFNHVRVPFSFRLFITETEPRKFEGVGYELLDRVIQWCKAESLYVILDMHAAPGGQTGDNIDDSWGYPFLFESPESQELTIKLWQTLAGRYQNEPIIIGYDLLNEPIAHYFDTNALNPKLEPLYRRIVAGIREVDRNHIVFLGGAQWNSNFRVFGPPFDDKLAYTFHKYWTDTTQSVIQEYIDFGNRYNVPVWMGESGENTDEWIGAMRGLLERNGIGWSFWPYKKLNSTSCVASIRRTPEWDAIVAFANHPRTTYEQIRNNRPLKEVVTKALSDYLENIKFTNCRIDEGFLRALGLR
jgi:hypothetical protein